MPLQTDQKVFNQVFIIASIQGIDGIIGMDFLNQYDGKLDIRKQTLETTKGQVSLNRQLSLDIENKSASCNIKIPKQIENIKLEKSKAKIARTIHTMHVRVDEDDESDDLYSVTQTDPTRVAYRDLSMSPVSSSSPAPGQPNGKMSESISESDVTRMPYWALPSLISPHFVVT